MTVAENDFRRIFGAFPTAVFVVTTIDQEGKPHGLTCNSVAAVSADPPLLLVCVDRYSRTLPALVSSGVFVVNVLAAGAQRTARTFASRSDRKFADVEWVPSSVAAGAPVLVRDVLAHAECTVVRQVEAGDHLIVVGQLRGGAVMPRPVLLYQRGEFGVWHGTAVSPDPAGRSDVLPESAPRLPAGRSTA